MQKGPWRFLNSLTAIAMDFVELLEHKNHLFYSMLSKGLLLTGPKWMGSESKRVFKGIRSLFKEFVLGIIGEKMKE